MRRNKTKVILFFFVRDWVKIPEDSSVADRFACIGRFENSGCRVWRSFLGVGQFPDHPPDRVEEVATDSGPVLEAKRH